MLNKILAILFFTLFVVVIVEVIFLFFNKNNVNVNTSSSVSNSSKSGISTNVDYLMSLVNDRGGTLINSTINLTYTGKIISIYNKPGTMAGVNYVEGVRIKGPKGNSDLMLLKNDVNHLNVVSNENGKENMITFRDLKVGDNIKLDVVKNLLEPFSDGQNTISMKITRQN